jgi:hypothetical protein
MNIWGDLEENTYTIGDVCMTEPQYKKYRLDQMNARAYEKEAKPELTPSTTLKSPLGVQYTHASNWEEQTRILTIHAYDFLSPDGSDLSRIINRQRADGKHPLFTRVVLDHHDVVTGQNVLNLERLRFTRDRIGQFSFTFDHAAHTGKKNFKPVPPEPKPELSWAESRLAAVRESLDFCRGASIHVTDAQIEDEKYWSGVVEAENAAKKSPAAKEIDAEIARLDDEIAKLKAKSS